MKSDKGLDRVSRRVRVSCLALARDAVYAEGPVRLLGALEKPEGAVSEVALGRDDRHHGYRSRARVGADKALRVRRRGGWGRSRPRVLPAAVGALKLAKIRLTGTGRLSGGLCGDKGQ